LSIRGLAVKMLEIYRRRSWDGRRPLPELVEVSGEEFYGQGYDDSDRRIPDIRKARRLLDWEPRFGLDETVECSMEYWLNAG
jgi:UDP-apiose/xylose synthase